VKPADHQLTLEPGREHLVGLAQLGECPLDDIHRVDPPEQGGIRLGDFERDHGALPPVADQPQRLLQQHARLVPSGAHPGPGCLAQNLRPLRQRRRLGQRTAQQNGRGLRRAVVHRRPRGLPQPRQHPAVTGRPDPGQVRGDPSRWGPVGVQ